MKNKYYPDRNLCSCFLIELIAFELKYFHLYRFSEAF